MDRRPEDIRLDSMVVTYDVLLEVLETIVIRLDTIEGVLMTKRLATAADLDQMEKMARDGDPLGPMREKIAGILNRPSRPDAPQS